jgi:hypothetical protein
MTPQERKYVGTRPRHGQGWPPGRLGDDGKRINSTDTRKHRLRPAGVELASGSNVGIIELGCARVFVVVNIAGARNDARGEWAQR